MKQREVVEESRKGEKVKSKDKQKFRGKKQISVSILFVINFSVTNIIIVDDETQSNGLREQKRCRNSIRHIFIPKLLTMHGQ